MVLRNPFSLSFLVKTNKASRQIREEGCYLAGVYVCTVIALLMCQYYVNVMAPLTCCLLNNKFVNRENKLDKILPQKISFACEILDFICNVYQQTIYDNARARPRTRRVQCICFIRKRQQVYDVASRMQLARNSYRCSFYGRTIKEARVLRQIRAGLPTQSSSPGDSWSPGSGFPIKFFGLKINEQKYISMINYMIN